MIQKLVEKMIFYPERGLSLSPDMLSLTYRDVYMTSAQYQIHGWFFPGKREETILFFHGNAGTIADRLDNVLHLVRLGFSVFIFDYRGYGLSEGRPSEEATYEDATTAWNWLEEKADIDSSKIVSFGRSLGGAIAIELSTRKQPFRLIIESTFTSIKELGHQLFPFISMRIIPDIYPTINRIGVITVPILLIHGTEDTLIPVQHSEKLYEAVKSVKFLYNISHANHNNTYLIAGDKYFENIFHFIVTGFL